MPLAISSLTGIRAGIALLCHTGYDRPPMEPLLGSYRSQTRTSIRCIWPFHLHVLLRAITYLYWIGIKVRLLDPFGRPISHLSLDQSLYHWCLERQHWRYEEHVRGNDGFYEHGSGSRLVAYSLVGGYDAWVSDINSSHVHLTQRFAALLSVGCLHVHKTTSLDSSAPRFGANFHISYHAASLLGSHC